MLKKAVIASDSFKGSLSSRAVADAAELALHSVFPECEVVKLCVADGGEGTVDALVTSMGGRMVTAQVHDPLMRPLEASYGIIGSTAVLEMAAASGLTLLTEAERNPLDTSTYGTGELILSALEHGCRDFLVCIGGSATNDAGMGMLSALGASFKDAEGNVLPGVGADLLRVASMDMTGLPQDLKECRFTVACDVDAPLYGEKGAACVFAPQKGADPEQVAMLDEGLASLAGVVSAHMGEDVSMMPGAGAAGGLGWAFRAMLGAELKPGVEMVLEAVRFDGLAAGADIIITGEGRMDAQTAGGKTPCGVLRHAQALGIPVLAIAGRVDHCPELDGMGFAQIRAISEGLPPEQAMDPAIASRNLTATLTAMLADLCQSLIDNKKRPQEASCSLLRCCDPTIT